jgi:hypothetical protein
MTTINQELYEALVAAGAPDEAAKRAAASVLGHEQRTDLATKADLAALDKRLAVVETRLSHVENGLNRLERLLWALLLGVLALLARGYGVI